MANLYADNYLSEPAPTASSSAILVAKAFVFTITAAFGDGDKIYLARLPAGTELLRWRVDVPELDSGSTIAWDLGDSTSATRFLSSSAVGQGAGGRVASDESGAGAVAGSTPCVYQPDGTATQKGDDDFIMTIATAAGAGSVTSGSIIGVVWYKQYGVGPPTFGN